MGWELVDISGELKFETERAYLFFDGVREAWLPKSQCEWDADRKIMTLPENIAIEKGLV